MSSPQGTVENTQNTTREHNTLPAKSILGVGVELVGSFLLFDLCGFFFKKATLRMCLF